MPVVHRRVLILAAAAGFLTGVGALSGHRSAVVAHAVGGVTALVLVAVVAYRVRDRATMALVGAMGVANLTGVAWTWYGATGLVVLSHLLTGLLATAGAVVLALSE